VAEEEKQELSPEELFLQPFYDTNKPIEERAQLFKDLLKNDKQKFFEQDFFHNTFYLHVMEIFDPKEDTHFQDITKEVINVCLTATQEDIQQIAQKANLGENEIDLFNITVRVPW